MILFGFPRLNTGITNNIEAKDGEERGSFWALFALLVVAAATLIALQGRRPRPADPYVGQPLPPLEAGGWLNTKAPVTTSDLRGKVVLVDFWASDCGPCIQHLPQLIAFNKRYHDRGLLIVGLSLESGYRAQHLKNFIETRDGLEWPVGYDARFAYEAMGITGTPTYLLYDRTGRSVWGGHSLDGLEDAAVAALAEKDASR